MFENRNRLQEKMTYFPFVAGENLEEHRKTVAEHLKSEMSKTMKSRASKINSTRSTLGDFKSGIGLSMTPKENASSKQDLISGSSSMLAKSKGL